MPATTFLRGRTDFTYLRGVALIALTDVGRVVAGTATSDQGGGASTTWAQTGSSFPCRVDAMGGGEAEVAGRISDTSTHVVVLPAAVNVTDVQRILVTGRGTFAITAVPHHTGEFLRTLEAVEV